MPTKQTFQDALKKAAISKQFAMDLILNPEVHKDQYNLSDAQIKTLKKLAQRPLSEILKTPTRAEVY
jgi:hypothetical protein